MKNTTQLKALVKNIAKSKNISAQLVLQNYMMERFIERISLSNYRENIIVKGGLLISSIVGLESRTTMDIDMTVKGKTVDEMSILSIIRKISNIKIDDGVLFEVVNINEIREIDEYLGYRISLIANMPPMKIPLKLDITTGDKIIPKEVNYSYPLMFENRSVSITAYNLETILSEKIETIISRGNLNTRMRDFYDVYILLKLQEDNINYEVLGIALSQTAKKRGSINVIKNYKEIVEAIQVSSTMIDRWKNYQISSTYAQNIEFFEICKILDKFLTQLVVDKWTSE
ncbi:nucleotidyl transferase AbiEii/AbiGii toxin family protein [Gemella sanguinis]|jgi:hypothetical protein|uniref:nucleotidyl transferase AbiEii/AbiGii toxin family protein n=1 Tax=Gemella sanguinis TaxID=84135 RepID=UPI0028D6F01E|nr:nucleotidyl transferase AbiEii/AbiGii toxin family protein [Gemella sanguinis]